MKKSAALQRMIAAIRRGRVSFAPFPPTREQLRQMIAEEVSRQIRRLRITREQR